VIDMGLLTTTTSACVLLLTQVSLMATFTVVVVALVGAMETDSSVKTARNVSSPAVVPNLVLFNTLAPPELLGI
jgi:hypothetical protein